MIPITNQIQSRAGPSVTPLARVDVPGTVAATQTEIPPVEEAVRVDEHLQLGRKGIGHARQPDAEQGDHRRVNPVKPAADDADWPQDRAVFRAKVIKFLSALYGDDAAFQRALKLGTIVVQAVEDQPDPQMRPELIHAVYRDRAVDAEAVAPRSHGGLPATVGPADFVAWWPK